VRANRAFLARTVRFLARDAGIRQFLDIGTGIPTASNTHEVARRAAPDSRIVYVDNDPIVLLHAQALLKSTPEGACATSTPTCTTRTRSWRARRTRSSSASR
jgi:S-adenosyl methyltransferase